MLTSSCRRSFLNYDSFYRSIGIDERLFTEDFDLPFDINRFEATSSDALFLDAALNAHMKGIADDPSPRFLYALTNFNHGPHNRKLVTSGQFEGERAFAAASLPDEHYAEYYARLAETAATWNRLKAELAARSPKRPTLIVHYGDHQPVMTRRIEKRQKLDLDPRQQFQTFYAIEAGMRLGRIPADVAGSMLRSQDRSLAACRAATRPDLATREPAGIAARLLCMVSGSAASTVPLSIWA